MPPNKSFVCVHAAKSAAKALKIFELHDEIVRRETELAQLKFQLDVLVSVIEYTERDKYMSKKCTCSRDGASDNHRWHDPACPVHNKNE